MGLTKFSWKLPAHRTIKVRTISWAGEIEQDERNFLGQYTVDRPFDKILVFKHEIQALIEHLVAKQFTLEEFF